MKVMIAAGGTGGHIFPALAVADELATLNHSVFWLGTRHGLEAKLVTGKYPLEFISVKGVRKSGLLAKVLAPWRILLASVQAARLLKKNKPDVVLAMGGYVAAVGGLVAKCFRIPLVVHEQNAVAGLANRLLAKIADSTLQAFDQAFAGSISAKTVGNPVRAAMRHIAAPEVRLSSSPAPLRILIVGGSQGASAINQCVLAVWPLLKDLHTVQVWHQTGEREYAEINAQYAELALAAKVAPFIVDMAAAYAWADLIICRAGAMTVSELSSVGAASILIPYPYAVDLHQHKNARYLSSQEAAILLDQKEMSPTGLAVLLEKFIQDRQSLLKMAQNAKQLAYDHAALSVAKECVKFGNGSHQHEVDNGC